MRLPTIIGHRGAAYYAPENTLSSIAMANDHGCQWVEVDVRLNRSLTPVLLHDATLDRTTNGFGELCLVDDAHLDQIDAGSWFSESFAHEKVPSLQTCLGYLSEKHMSVNLELKPTAQDQQALVSQVAHSIQSERQLSLDAILISSFSQIALQAFQSVMPSVHLALCVEKFTQKHQQWLEHVNMVSVHLDHRYVTEALVDRLHQQQLQVAVYTVNDPIVAQSCFDKGIDCIFSDKPDLLAGAS